MDKRKKLQNVTTAIAQSSVALSFPYCTVILHQPKLPKKLERELENKVESRRENFDM